MTRLMNMGPQCCCCNNIYARDQRLIMGRITGDKAQFTVEAEQDSNSAPDNLSIDYVNERIYARNNLLTRIYSWKTKDLSDRRLEFTEVLAGFLQRGIAVYPWSPPGQIVYSYNYPQAIKKCDLRRCDYGGANDTLLFEIIEDTVVTSPSFLTSPGVFNIAISKSGRCFAQVSFDHNVQRPLDAIPDVSQYTNKIVAFDLDGSNQNDIYTGIVDWGSGMNVDNNHHRLIFIEVEFSSGGGLIGTHIKSCKLDGSDMQTIYEDVTINNAIRVFGYSHLKNRIYFWSPQSSYAGGTGIDKGFHSMKPNGSDLKKEIDSKDWMINPRFGEVRDPIFGKLGCGYELFGSNTMASS